MNKKIETTELIRNRINELKDKQHMTINALAIEGEIKPSSLQSFMNGTSKNPTIKTIEGVANGLDMSVAEFFDFYPFNERKSKRKQTEEINEQNQINELREKIKEELKKELLEEMKKEQLK